MVTLKHFSHADVPDLRQSRYADLPAGEIVGMIDAWNSREYQGRYFEMLAIVADGRLVGMISLYQRSASVVSVGPEVFPAFRRQGFGKEAMRQALILAREKGYRIAAQQVRCDNLPSIALHRSLGFETDDQVCINRKGHPVFSFLKALLPQNGA